jgi:hypothetical protein
MSEKLNRSCLITLFDNPKNRKKLVFLGKLETMMDDIDNGQESMDFCVGLEDELEWGKTYKLTIQEM